MTFPSSHTESVTKPGQGPIPLTPIHALSTVLTSWGGGTWRMGGSEWGEKIGACNEEVQESKGVKGECRWLSPSQVGRAFWLKGGLGQKRGQIGGECEWPMGRMLTPQDLWCKSLSWETIGQNHAVGGSMVESNYVQILFPGHSADKLLSLSVPWFLHLQNNNSVRTPFMKFWWGLMELIHQKQYLVSSKGSINHTYYDF